VRYCGPILIEFKKQTAALAKEETSVVEERIRRLETRIPVVLRAR
jgi:hypothetical protein